MINLPEKVKVGLIYEGLTFELRVAALPRGCEILFPDLTAADEVFSAACLPAEAVQAAASALDAAVAQFRTAFQASLSNVLIKHLDMPGEHDQVLRGTQRNDQQKEAA